MIHARVTRVSNNHQHVNNWMLFLYALQDGVTKVRVKGPGSEDIIWRHHALCAHESTLSVVSMLNQNVTHVCSTCVCMHGEGLGVLRASGLINYAINTALRAIWIIIPLVCYIHTYNTIGTSSYEKIDAE